MSEIELNPATLFFLLVGAVAVIGFIAAVTVPGFMAAAEPEEPSGGAAGHVEPEAHGHPGPVEYLQIAVVLAAVTALEVGLYYIERLSDGLVVTLLLVFAAVKFALVALWFMHLKFDSRLFSGVFAGGIAIAAAMYLVVLLTFNVFG